MYTKLDDQRQAKFIKNYIEEHPNCTIKDVIQGCVVSRIRLYNLAKQGYFKLPKLVSERTYDSEFIDKINSFIKSGQCRSGYHLRTTFNIGYESLKKLENNGLIQWSYYG